MFDRLRGILVESFIGAIALGYLLAEAVLSFGNVFTAPLATWIRRRYFETSRRALAVLPNSRFKPRCRP